MPIIRKYKNLLLGLLTMICLGIFIFYKSEKDYKSLDKNFEIIIVTIIDVKISGGVYYLQYDFRAKSKAIRGQTRVAVGNTNLTYLNSVFVGQKILLAVDSTDERNNILLLSRRDYQRFQLKPSDSILSVFQKIDSLRTTKFD